MLKILSNYIISTKNVTKTTDLYQFNLINIKYTWQYLVC